MSEKGAALIAQADERLLQLKAVSTGTVKRHAVVEAQFAAFLQDVGADANLMRATPADVVRYLCSLDGSGTVVVHAPDCPLLMITLHAAVAACACPRRAAADSVNTRRGLLQAVFRDLGVTSPWCSSTASGNPVNSALVDQYIQQLKREQAAAAVVPRKAPLVAAEVMWTLLSAGLSVIARAHRRGQHRVALLALQDVFYIAFMWFTGLRAADALRVLAQQVDVVASGGARVFVCSVFVTKTAKSAKQRRVLRVAGDAALPHSLPALYVMYRDYCALLSVPLQPGPLFSKLASRGPTELAWSPDALTQPCMAGRFRALLDVAGLPHAITMHSCHASRMRSLLDAGTPVSRVCAQLDTTPATLRRYTQNRAALSLEQTRLLLPAPRVVVASVSAPVPCVVTCDPLPECSYPHVALGSARYVITCDPEPVIVPVLPVDTSTSPVLPPGMSQPSRRC